MANVIDMDALFNGATVTLNTVQNAAGAIADGINDVRNSANSRRNMGGYQQSNSVYNGYAQPVSYGYGYSEGVVYNGYNGSRNYYQQSTCFGINNYGGYPGFTNPGYGSTTGYVQQTNTNRPQGGAWG